MHSCPVSQQKAQQQKAGRQECDFNTTVTLVGFVKDSYSVKLRFIFMSHKKKVMFKVKLSFFFSSNQLKNNSRTEFIKVFPWIPSVATVSVIDVHSCQGLSLLDKLSHHCVRGP